jgi:hypothetical protein
MLRLIVFILFISTSFPQVIDENLFLVETKKILTYMNSFDKIYEQGGEEALVAINISNSAARSVNVVMNAYHLIHIYNMIDGDLDKAKVEDYLKQQLPHTLRLLNIEQKLTTSIISPEKDKEIKYTADLYIISLDYVIKILNSFT